MSTAPTDAELVARCRTGDDEAWELLVERFARYVHATSTRGVHASLEHAAEDAFQEVFARAYEQLERLRDDAAIRPWLAQLDPPDRDRRVCAPTPVESARDVAEIEARSTRPPRTSSTASSRR